VDEATMRALLHLPTLTALHSARISFDAWPVLPQLPRLRQLSFSPYSSLTPSQLSSLCAAFSHCSALVDLTLKYMHFNAAEDGELTAEEERPGWSSLLSSVPNLRRLGVDGNVTDLLPVQPLHLPALKHLSLSNWGGREVDPFRTLAHSNLRVLEPEDIGMPLFHKPMLQSLLHSERFPKLERCIRR
jgi:hypothetical protein